MQPTCVIGLHPATVFSALDIFHPFLVIKIPLHRFAQAILKGMRGMPVELCVELAAIDGIAEIMTGTVSHKSDEIGIRSLYGGTHIIKDRANAVHNLKVGPFGIAADIIGLPHPAVLEYSLNGVAVIFDMQPVTDIGSRPVHRQGLTARAFSVTSGISFSGNWRGP